LKRATGQDRKRPAAAVRRWPYLAVAGWACFGLALGTLPGLSTETPTTPVVGCQSVGYNITCSQAPPGNNSAIALTRVATNYSSGPNLTVSFQVAGAVNLSSGDYGYFIFFDGTNNSFAPGSTTVNSVTFTDNLTAGVLAWSANTTSGLYSQNVGIALALSGSNSTLTTSIGTNEVGPSSSFFVNVESVYVGSTYDQKVWLGSNNSTGSSATAKTSMPSSWANTLALAGLIAIPAALIALVLIRRRRRPPSTVGEFT
jgi:hypothetical protein